MGWTELQAACVTIELINALKKRSKNIFFYKALPLIFALLQRRVHTGKTKDSYKIGSLAQLVQSICLTSRGSAVRTRQLPPKAHKKLWDFFIGYQGIND